MHLHEPILNDTLGTYKQNCYMNYDKNILEIQVFESVLLEYKQASDVWILVIVYSGLHCCRQQSTSPHFVYCYTEGPFSKSKLEGSKS